MTAKPCQLMKVGNKKSKKTGNVAVGVFDDYVLEVGMPFYGFADQDSPQMTTSRVLNIIEAGNVVVFETKNSIYWLMPHT